MNKKSVHILLILLLAFGSFHQEVWSQGDSTQFKRQLIHIGVTANFPVIPFHRDIYDPDINAGFYGKYEVGINKALSFHAGLGFYGISYSRQASDTNELFTQRNREFYAQVPLGLSIYPFGSKRSLGFHAAAIPSVLAIKSVVGREENPNLVDYGSDPSQPGRLDLGVQVGISFPLTPQVSGRINYMHSLSSAQNPAYNAGRFSSLNFGVSFQVFDSRNRPKEEKKVEVENRTTEHPDFLLVRLKTEHKKIAAYERSGYQEEANKIRAEVAEENQLTREGFKQSFSSIPVYCFYDTSTLAIVEGRLNQQLVDLDGKVVSDSIPRGLFWIAEFGSVYSKTFGNSSGFGLVVYDSSMNQLADPVPYYTPNYFGLISRSDVIRRFELKMNSYLGKP